MKAFVSLVVLALLAAASPRVSAAPPQDAAARKAWDALDFEAKWLRYRGDAAPLDEWVKFLGGAKEFELLEWVALTTREGNALEELVRLDAPNWIRSAVWRLESSDTHSVGGASKSLTEKSRPARVLDWFDHHPSAVGGAAAGVVKKLREHQPPLVAESSSADLPPLDPDVVLKALKPPATVYDFEAVRKRTPDDVYVHQVVRALDTWTLSTLLTPTWVSRVIALLVHAHPEVRRAAALACVRLPASEIPVAALEGLIDDVAEQASVRAAAVLAASYAPGPEPWLRLHGIAAEPRHVGWSAAVSRLADLGDEFSVERLEALTAEVLDDAARKLRADTIKRIREQLTAETPADRAIRLVAMLERAAFADLRCSPLETTLVPSAIAVLRAHVAEPEVKGAIEGLRKDAGSKDATRERLAEYAADILGPVAPPQDAKPPR